jgi:hypothetical protein
MLFGMPGSSDAVAKVFDAVTLTVTSRCCDALHVAVHEPDVNDEPSLAAQ